MLSIPRGDLPIEGKPGVDPNISWDITDVQIAESRMFEVAAVTAHKANELLALFNNAFLETGKALAQARYQHVKAEQAISRRRAVIITDILPAKLVEKGLASARSPLGSEDIRNAFIEQDEAFIAMSDRRDKIKAIMELLETKKKAFENAYTSVKKILGENNYTARNGDLSGGHAHENLQAGDNIEKRPYRWGPPKD